MSRKAPGLVHARGFTLIEVLLAVSVFAIVLAAINSVFFSALRLRNKTVQTFEKALPLQQALGQIKKDFNGIMLPGGRFSGKFSTTAEGLSNNVSFAGERVTPDIYTSSGKVGELARWADVQKVAYFLAAPTNDFTAANGRDLVRLVTHNLLPVSTDEPEVQWLMGGIQTLRMQYYDGMSWTETWDSNTSTNLPAGIKVQITLTEDYTNSTQVPAPIELVFPTMVHAASTNTTEETNGGEQ